MQGIAPFAERMTLRIQLLGAFRVTLGSQAIEDAKWRRRKASTLIKLLALAPNHRLHREQILDHIWPDLAPPQAANSFHQTLHLARFSLDSTEANKTRWLRLEEDFLILAPDDALWIDVQAFEEAAAVARRGRDPSAYRRALDLYAGELLPDDRYEEWVTARRESLRQEHLSLLTALAGLYQAAREHEKAIETFKRVLEIETTHEDAHDHLMELYALTGRRDEALKQFQVLRETLGRELDAEPTLASQHLHQRILTGDLQPLEARPAIPVHNLPTALTSFVGREREQKEVKRFLRTARLLTLTGPGGCGKTRLAVQVARDVLGEYRDGVWLVELAALSDPTLVPRALASALGVIEQAGQPLLATIKRTLASKQLLIVLDNCEHLVQACTQLANELLTYCPHLTILATSREPLHITGEVVWLVPSLALPELEPLPPFQHLVEYEAIRLFAERAASVIPLFALTPDNAPAVAHICFHLDGMPLAIELAVARMNVLSVEQILTRLDDRFRLLTVGSRAALNRQQTLHATIDWSHELLDEKERVLFRRLAVFAGGCTLEAVEAICAGDGIATLLKLDPAEMLDLVSRLVDRSLVLVDRSINGPRYRLLETIREYAHQKLVEAGEASVIGERHRTWFTALVEQANLKLWGRAHLEGMNHLERDYDNLRAALAWSLEYDPPSGLQLAASLWQFWILRGYLSEADQILTSLLRQMPQRTALRARSLLTVYAFKVRAGDNPAAVSLAEDSLDIYRQINDPTGSSQALQMLGAVAFVRGDCRRAQALFESSLTLARETGDTCAIACATYFLGASVSGLGDLDLAQQLIQESIRLLAQSGNRPSITPLFINLGTEAVYGGEKRWWVVDEETIVLLRQMGAPVAQGYALANLGTLARRQQDYTRARALLEEALTLFRTMDDRAGMGQVLNQLGNLASLTHDYTTAANCFEQSLTIRREMGERRGMGRTMCSIANLAILERDFDRAHAILNECAELFEQMGDRPGLAATSNHLGNVALAEGDTARAETCHRESVERFQQLVSKRPAIALLNWAETARVRGDDTVARSRLESSLSLFKELGDRVGMATVNELLDELTRQAQVSSSGEIITK